MADSSSAMTTAPSTSILAELSGPMPTATMPIFPTFTAVGTTTSSTPIPFTTGTITSSSPTLHAVGTTTPRTPLATSSTGGTTNPPPTVPTLLLPPTVANIPHPPMAIPIGTSTAERQFGVFGNMPPSPPAEQSNAALAQTLALMAENMARMQGLLVTLVQNQASTPAIVASMPSAIPSMGFPPLAQPPFAGLAHGGPFQIPPLFPPCETYGAIPGSAPFHQVPIAVVPSFHQGFIPRNTPPASMTMANPTPTQTPEPRQAEVPIRSPHTRNVAFVDELLQENLHDDIETRLETRIASLREAERRRLSKIEERLDAVQGSNIYTVEDADLHVPQFRVPHKYKTPDFEKFNGEGCPRMHLRHFLHKMSIYGPDDLLRIHAFQESLTGPAYQWYHQLDTSQYLEFKELAIDFMNNYNFNMELAPTISDLRRLERHRNETIKQFALRFRDKAQLVRPQIKEKELVDEFIRLLPHSFLPYMVGQRQNSFSRVVLHAQDLEDVMKKPDPAAAARPLMRGKPKEIVAQAEQAQRTYRQVAPPVVHAPRAYTPMFTQPRPAVDKGKRPAVAEKSFPKQHEGPSTGTRQSNRPRRRLEELTPTPDPIDVMFFRLKDMGYITPVPPKETNPSSIGYNPKAVCHYHSGALGHDTKDCIALRFKIQNLLDDRIITFAAPATTPSIQQNPLPEHVNMVEPGEIETTIPPLIHVGEHTLPPHEEYVNVVRGTGEAGVRRPYRGRRTARMTVRPLPATFEYRPGEYVRPPFHYVSQQTLNVGASSQGSFSTGADSPGSPELSSSAANSAVMPSKEEVGIITRSGRVVAPPEKDKEVSSSKVKEPSLEEARQVIKLLKTSDYSIVEQLRKQPAQISLFDLIQSSDKHRDALQKFLAEVHVPAEIEVNTLDTFVNSLLSKDSITFSEEDLPDVGLSHNNALYITVKCQEKMVPKTLIDGGSGVNIIPLGVARQLNIEEDKLVAPQIVVRAFDGAKRKVLGEISLAVQVGPVTFDVVFQVLEASGSFNMLLGRPWIHAAGAIPSTVHQMVKFISSDKVITVKGEYDMPICNEIDMPCVAEPTGEPGTAQTFEVVHMVRRELFEVTPTEVNVARTLIKHGYQLGRGLGANLQGDLQPIYMKIKVKNDRDGLGYNEDISLDPAKTLKFCRKKGFPPIARLFVASTKGTLEHEQLLRQLENVEINMIDEASDPSQDISPAEG